MSDRKRVGLMIKAFSLGSLFTLLLIGVLSSCLDERVNFLDWRVLFLHDLVPAGKPTPQPPCGLLEAIELPLANTEGRLRDEAERFHPPRWCFDGFTAARLSEVLQTCGFTKTQRQMLLAEPYCKVTERGFEIKPPEALVWHLSQENRQRLYAILAKSPGNYVQRYPFRFQPGTLEERLYLSGLSRREIEAVSRLTYTNYLGLQCLSDLQTARSAMSTNGFNNLVGALYQSPAFILRLKVTPESNVEQLAQYWGKGGREKLIQPLLKALRRVPGGGSINVSIFLPPFARLRLFTFPDAWADPTAARQDCIFTSLNFFNDEPDTNFLNADYVQRAVDSEYAKVSDNNPVYGDLLALVDEESNQTVHMCVYVAEGFVFTKNGISRDQPWVLMRWTDVLKEYSELYHTDKVVILRCKHPGSRSRA